MTPNEALIAFFTGNLKTKTATISSSTDTSDAVDYGDMNVAAIVCPAAFDGTNFTFLLSNDDVTYTALSKTTGSSDNATVSVAFAANSRIGVLPFDLASGRYLKIQSDSTETSDRAFTVVLRSF